MTTNTEALEAWLASVIPQMNGMAFANPNAQPPVGDVYVSNFGPVTVPECARLLSTMLTTKRVEALLNEALFEDFMRNGHPELVSNRPRPLTEEERKAIVQWDDGE